MKPKNMFLTRLKKMKKIKDSLRSLSSLGLDNKIVEKLKLNGISSTMELCKTNRKTLKKLNFSVSDVNYIEVKLQLLGLDLSRK